MSILAVVYVHVFHWIPWKWDSNKHRFIDHSWKRFQTYRTVSLQVGWVKITAKTLIVCTYWIWYINITYNYIYLILLNHVILYAYLQWYKYLNISTEDPGKKRLKKKDSKTPAEAASFGTCPAFVLCEQSPKPIWRLGILCFWVPWQRRAQRWGQVG